MWYFRDKGAAQEGDITKIVCIDFIKFVLLYGDKHNMTEQPQPQVGMRKAKATGAISLFGK